MSDFIKTYDNDENEISIRIADENEFGYSSFRPHKMENKLIFTKNELNLSIQYTEYKY